MRRIDELLERYGESHRHPANKAIHWVCVPLITWCVLGFFWAASPVVAYALIALAVAYYVTLSPALAAGMLGVSAVLVYPLTLLGPHVLATAVVVFVLAWIGQFAGHRIEGRKPSFLDDVRFLLIGPVWLLADVYRRAGIRY
ncbi:MAG: Mpo1-like protein [Burkholderiales bacterium]